MVVDEPNPETVNNKISKICILYFFYNFVHIFGEDASLRLGLKGYFDYMD